MLDTMTMTKVVGALCGALLVFLLGGWVAEALYFTGGGHGAEEQAYLIEGGDDSASPEETREVDFTSLVAAADPADGAKGFRQCAACHKIDEPANGAGPHLDGVAGRQIAAVSDFSYSGALPAGEWTIDNLNHWLTNPSEFAPGTSMSFRGIKDDEDRAAMVAYLISKSPDFAMPEPAAEPAAATEQEAEADLENTEAEAATSGDAAQEAASEGTEGMSEGEAQAVAEAGDAAAGGSAIAAAYAAADVDNGKKVFRQCQACHAADSDRNGVGPNLVNVLGRQIGSVDGFGYSGALPDGEWTLENLDHWLTKPQDFASGTSMSFRGLRDQQDRADVIAYIESVSN